MVLTMAQALAEHIRGQVAQGEQVLEAAGENSGEVFGSPADVLTVCGNIADVAYTNHLWLLDAAAAGLGSVAAELQRPRPERVQDAVAFLAPRETDSCDQALAHLRRVNEGLASMVEGLSDIELDRPLDAAFCGSIPLRDMLFSVIEHGSLHIGQAWGILKGKGLLS
jgi:hypothetical protein